MTVVDLLGRPLRSLRLSVTDRCNLRCRYCMPEDDYAWLPRDHLLSGDEIVRLVEAFVSLGVSRIRLTGGEPLLRADLSDLVRRISSRPGVIDVALTTNGVLLAEQADDLADAGLHRVTVSLDTLRPDRFQMLTRLTSHGRVIDGIKRAGARFAGLKIDTVVLRHVNDDELVPLVEFGREHRAEVRFIEYMDVAGATRWDRAHVVSRDELLDRLAEHYGTIDPLDEPGGAPADRFRLPDGTLFGVIASTSHPFCRTCDRARVTADGLLLRCLYATAGMDLRTALGAGEPVERLAHLIASAWGDRDARGAEHRQASPNRQALVPPAALRTDPHLEMHTRGG